MIIIVIEITVSVVRVRGNPAWTNFSDRFFDLECAIGRHKFIRTSINPVKVY